MKKGKDEVEYIPEDLSSKASARAEDKIKKIKQKLKACQKEKEEYLAGWQRAKADLINYKKKQEQKIFDYYKFASEGLILEILMVLDSFELALQHSKNEGIQQLYNQLKNILESNGVEEIKAMGEKFNPEFHESVGEIKGRTGIVIEEIQKGYLLNGKVIRASKIKVGRSESSKGL